MKNLLVLSLFILSLISCSQKPQNEFRINGVVNNVPDGTVFELIPIATHKEEKALAIDTVYNGKFTFTGSLTEPRLLSIRAAKHYGGYNLMISNEDVKFSGDYSSDDMGEYSLCTFDGVKLKGASLQNDYLDKISVREEMNKIYTENNENAAQLHKDLRDAYKEKDSVRIAELQASDAYLEMEKAEAKFFETVNERYTSLISSNGNSFWGPLLMLELLSYFGDEQKVWFEGFSQEAKESYYGKLVSEELYPVGMKGQKVPGLISTVSGKEQDIIGDNLGAKYTIIDFWASWCKPCRKEIPNLKLAYEKYAPMGLQIISISIDKNDKQWKKALDEENLSWPNYIDTEGFADTYKVKFIPSIFLVDKNGVLIEENIKGEALTERLAELFAI